MSYYDPKQKKQKYSSWGDWVLPVALLLFVPPLGIGLLVLRLLDKDSRKRAPSRHPYDVQMQGRSMPTGARTTAPAQPPVSNRSAAVRAQAFLSQLSAKGRNLAILGGVVAFLFGAVSLASLGDSFVTLTQSGFPAFLQSQLSSTVPSLCIAAAGGGCLWAGLNKRMQVKRFRNYLAMIGQNQAISVSALANASGCKPEQVREDLADLLEAGLFPQGFLDYGGDRLVLSGEGLSEPLQKGPESDHTAASQDTDNSILAEIRAVNDAIDNEKLSAQIDRIGDITSKILAYQRTNPEKSPELHSFLSYYLPTTLKILRAYARLEDQGVSGENIQASMQRIEGMMDKVVEGFEKQLDQLFQGDAMDIASDVDVLERMMAKDGLSGGQGFTLGL